MTAVHNAFCRKALPRFGEQILAMCQAFGTARHLAMMRRQ